MDDLCQSGIWTRMRALPGYLRALIPNVCALLLSPGSAANNPAQPDRRHAILRACLSGCLVLLITAAGLAPGYGQEKSLQVSEQELRKAAIYKPEPEYPAVARQIRVVGEVELLVAVDPNGQVDKVTVTRGNTLLAGPCTQAMKKWKFNPFHADGQAVHAVGPVKFNFQM